MLRFEEQRLDGNLLQHLDSMLELDPETNWALGPVANTNLESV
jgi:hypothetical protein